MKKLFLILLLTQAYVFNSSASEGEAYRGGTCLECSSVFSGAGQPQLGSSATNAVLPARQTTKRK